MWHYTIKYFLLTYLFTAEGMGLYSVNSEADFDEVDLWWRLNDLTSNTACQRH